jgi:hypothetical protein
MEHTLCMLQKGFVNVPMMVFITCLIVVGGVFYLVGRSSIEQPVTKSLEPTASVSTLVDNSIKRDPTASNNWETIDINKVEGSWQAYSVSYPKTWHASERYIPGAGSEVVLSKDDNKITITQGAGDGNECLFNKESKQGQVSHFTNKKEIQQKSEVWRRSQLTDKSNGIDQYEICAKGTGQDFFMSATSIGWVRIETPGSQSDILMEVDQILEKIRY